MKLATNTNISIDGVMQGLGGPEEDPTGGFERGGWAMPFFGGETEALISQVYGRADAFLFGRRTYEVFADSWGAMEDMKTTRSGKRSTLAPSTWHRPHSPSRAGRARPCSPVMSWPPSGS